MKTLRTIWLRIRSLLQRREVKREIDEELRFHIEQRTAENIAAGMSPEEAAREARKRFGNVQSIREECRETKGASFGEATFRDVRFGLRILRKSPGFTSTVVLTLGLGIGACTTMFSVIEAVMLKPLPVADQQSLVAVWGTNAKLGINQFSQSVPNYFDYRDQAKSFAGLAVLRGFSGNVTLDGSAVRLEGNEATANFTQVLGWQPILGRSFTAEEDRPGAARVAMISAGFWRDHLGADPGVIGRKIDVNGEPHEIVGVLNHARSLGDQTDIWRPLAASVQRESRGNHMLFMFGRLKPGVSREQAQSEMEAIAANIRAANPDYKGWSVRLESFYDMLVPPRLRAALVILFAAVGCVLLIACANVANLLLARALSREHEIAVRLALGARRWHLVRQMLAETALLAAAATGAGLLIAFWSVNLLRSALPQSVLPSDHIGVNAGSLLFAAAAGVCVTLLSGLVPALRGATGQPAARLSSGMRTGGGTPQSNRLCSSLVMTQFALSTVLLVGAGLLLHSFQRLQRIDPGFRATGVMTFQISPSPARYNNPAARTAFYNDLVGKLEALPGVTQVALSSGMPFGGGTTSMNASPVDPSSLQPDESIQTSWRIVSPGYFQALGVPLLQGRAFTGTDIGENEPVIIISEKLARRLWGKESALGKRLRPGPNAPYTVVGVVGDTTLENLTGDDRPAMFFSLGQWWQWETMTVAVKADVAAATLAPAIRTVVQQLDPLQPVFNFRTMESLVTMQLQSPRLSSVLLTTFAALALVLAAVGIYSVMAASVARRTHEIGIRMALGAQNADIARLVLGHGLRLAAAGVLIGLAGAYAVARLLTSLLYDTATTDPVAYAATALILSAATLLACYLPARRATRVDPIIALRCE